jgi:hypothetical protein
VTKRTNGAATTKAAPKPRQSGKNQQPGVLVRDTPAAIALWTRAAKAANVGSRNDWATNVLTVAAADQLGLDPLEALQAVSGKG